MRAEASKESKQLVNGVLNGEVLNFTGNVRDGWMEIEIGEDTGSTGWVPFKHVNYEIEE